MPSVHHICRLATVEDIRKSEPLWGQDRPLFDSDVWARMPDLLENLLQNELVRLAYIEALPKHEPRMLGGISFIHPEYLDEARAKGSTLPNTVFRAVLEHRTPFLSPKKIGKINAQCELHLMNFFGNFNDLDLTQSEMANFYEVSNQGYHFFHFGYAYRARSIAPCRSDLNAYVPDARRCTSQPVSPQKRLFFPARTPLPIFTGRAE